VNRPAWLLPLAVTALLAATIGIGVAREIALGASAVASADDAIARLDWPEAIDRARAAAEATAPFSSWPERGANQLQAIAGAAEARGDIATALVAYGALRGAALASPMVSGPRKEWQALAAEGVARVAAMRSGDLRSHEPKDATPSAIAPSGPIDLPDAIETRRRWSLATIALAA
jgi:hypothetical protein